MKKHIGIEDRRKQYIEMSSYMLHLDKMEMVALIEHTVVPLIPKDRDLGTNPVWR